jgi:hypothetical protein
MGAAYSIADRNDRYKPHRLSVDAQTLDSVHISKLGKLDGFQIWGVDGELVRDTIDIDFTIGGNGARYGYIPEDEIWVESELETPDAAATSLHELTELRAMRDRGLTYEQAHAQANIAESKMRAGLLKNPSPPGNVAEIVQGELERQAEGSATSAWLKART